jgi:GntR family transcriptional regulator
MQGRTLEAFLRSRISEQPHGLRSAIVAQTIEEAVQREFLAPGDALPAERVLCQIFSVSRTTLRRALDLLGKAGVVDRRVGAGNFVSVRVRSPKGVLIGFTEDVRSRGMTPMTQVLSSRRGTVSPDECFNLGLLPGSHVLRLERLRVADDQPIALELSVLPDDAVPSDFDGSTSLYSAMERKGSRPIRVVQRYGATLATPKQAELLGLQKGEALLLIQRLGFSSADRAVEFTRALFRGDQFYSPSEHER